MNAVRTGGVGGGMVTSKGAGLNPNAKVWQEIPAEGSQPSSATDGAEGSRQENTSHGTVPCTEGCVEGKVHGETQAPPSETPVSRVTAVNGMDLSPGELDCPPQGPSQIAGVSAEELAPSVEDLRESLRKQLEFCFSRENLSKDLYLVSQMNSDHFVPIWTIANIDGVKKLTTDLELILDVLRSSPMVQVDEKGEKVRPNHKRCIIILREIPEATPVEDVQALFRSENCPAVIGCEFAHNNSWYITFQSDSDAQQAFQYLREEVKTFQGKPILARIKAKPIAINTFFPKNGYRGPDPNLYPQQQYTAPLFMQPVFSPQQQYPLYSILPHAWSTTQPYFETPLAPFPNSGFVNGFSSAGSYKGNSSPQSIVRPYYRNRSQGKTHPRSGPPEVGLAVGPLSLSDTRLAPQNPHVVPGHQDQASGYPNKGSPPPLGSEQSPDSGLSTRGRRGTYRGRRRRDEDRTMRLPPAEIPAPKLDLAPSNFPPLPGSVVSSQGESVLENRMSDVVRGLNKDTETSKDERTSPPVLAAGDAPHDPSPPTPGTGPCVNATAPTEPSAASASGPRQSETSSLPDSAAQTASHTKNNVASPPAGTARLVTNAAPPPPEPRKLSYAEVCQKPATPREPRSGVPRSEESERPADRTQQQERPKEGAAAAPRGGGPPSPAGGRSGTARAKEQLRQFGCKSSPQGLGRQHSRKEQSVPPRSPK